MVLTTKISNISKDSIVVGISNASKDEIHDVIGFSRSVSRQIVDIVMQDMVIDFLEIDECGDASYQIFVLIRVGLTDLV